MTVQTVKLAGKRFVIVEEKDFERLVRKAELLTHRENGSARKKAKRLTAQDRGDLAEAMRRKSDAKDRSLPYAQARRRLGIA